MPHKLTVGTRHDLDWHILEDLKKLAQGIYIDGKLVKGAMFVYLGDAPDRVAQLQTIQ